MSFTAQNWENVFSPFTSKYRKKVIVKDDTLIEFEKWIEVKKKLTYNLIDKALKGKSTIGYFSTLKTKIVGIDIDHHFQGSFLDGLPCPQLQEKYLAIVKRLGFYPSLLFKSPHGLHAYYLFDYHSVHEIFEVRLKEKLQGLSFEILPTPNRTLRIDPVKNCIDQKTFNFVNIEKLEIEIYSPYSVLNSTCLPEEQRIKDNETRGNWKKGKSLFNQAKLEKMEKSILPIAQGTTNEKIFKSSLLPIYFRVFNGNVGDTVKRVQDCLLFPSGYKGELNKEKRLRERIESSFRTLEKKGYEFSGNRESKERSLMDTKIINELVNQHPFSRQRKSSVNTFLENLFSWLNYQDEILKNKRELVFWDWYYQKYSYYRKLGFYPLPSQLMQSWNKRYKDIITWLEDIHILKLESNYHYDSYSRYNSICRFYSVSRLIETRKPLEAYFFIKLEKTGLKQSEIAKLLGVSRQAVHNWLNGKRTIKETKVKEYMSLLNKHLENVNRTG